MEEVEIRIRWSKVPRVLGPLTRVVAPRALAKASVGLRGCGCGGPSAGVAAGLGLDLGREAIPCTNPAYAARFAARFAALGLKPPKSRSADHVGVQTQAFPTQTTPPKPSPCQQWATNRQWVPPPLFLLRGEDVGLRQLNHLHPHIGGGGGTSIHRFPGPVATPMTR